MLARFLRPRRTDIILNMSFFLKSRDTSSSASDTSFSYAASARARRAFPSGDLRFGSSRVIGLSHLQASRVYPISSPMGADHQRSSQPYPGSLVPGPSGVLSVARGENYQGVPSHNEPNRKDRKSLCASQPEQEALCQQDPRAEFSPEPSWQCHSSAANIDPA